MGATALSKRDNWQLGARVVGDKGETDTLKALALFMREHYEITLKSTKIPIYADGKGIVLDIRITNTLTGYTLFVEVKTGNNGGNATEERASKFLSEVIRRRVRGEYKTPHNPFFLIFGGDIFTGRHGKQQPYVIERTNNKTGKITKTKIQPKAYREKVNVTFEGTNYAFLEKGASNAEQISKQIMEII